MCGSFAPPITNYLGIPVGYPRVGINPDTKKRLSADPRVKGLVP